MRRVGRCNIRLLKTLSEHAGGFATESMRNQFLGELGLLVSEVRELRKRSERDAETIRCLRDQLFLKDVDPSYRADPCNPISEGGGGSGPCGEPILEPSNQKETQCLPIRSK